MPRASIYTLGCRLNQADSALIADDLVRHGYTMVPWGDAADVVVVNSCTVTAAAARKTRSAVRAIRKALPGARVVLVGCDANVSPEAWERETCVDLVVPNPDKMKLGELLADRGIGPAPDGAPAAAEPSFVAEGAGWFGDRTRANIKIQEGCDFFCSYCIVPQARGAPRSRSREDVLRELGELVERGHREIVLTGVNIATYGDGDTDLGGLLRDMIALPGDFRIRLSSTEPGPVIRDVVEVMRQNPERVCRFLHLPLQYGEDSILRAMNRRYSLDEYSRIAQWAADEVPGMYLGTDVIVGFPGESDETFARCCRTIEELPVNHLHVFTFSPRRGTPAAEFGDRVPGDVAAQRAKTLSAIGRRKAEAFARSQLGCLLSVVVEERNAAGFAEGWSDNYLRVEIRPDSPEARENCALRVRVSSVLGGRRVRGQPVRGNPGD